MNHSWSDIFSESVGASFTGVTFKLMILLITFVVLSLTKNLNLCSPKKSEYQKFEICEEHGKAYEGNKDTYMKYFKEYFDERFY